MKRKIAMLLAVVMLVTLLPTQVFANTGSSNVIHPIGGEPTGFVSGSIFSQVDGMLGAAARQDRVVGSTLSLTNPTTMPIADPFMLSLTLTNGEWVHPLEGLTGRGGGSATTGTALNIGGVTQTYHPNATPVWTAGDRHPNAEDFLASIEIPYDHATHGASTADQPAHWVGGVVPTSGVGRPTANHPGAATIFGAAAVNIPAVAPTAPINWPQTTPAATILTSIEVPQFTGWTAGLPANWSTSQIPGSVNVTGSVGQSSLWGALGNNWYVHGGASGNPDRSNFVLSNNGNLASATVTITVRPWEAHIMEIRYTGTALNNTDGRHLPLVFRAVSGDSPISMSGRVDRLSGVGAMPTWGGVHSLARTGEMAGATTVEVQGRATGRLTFDIDRLVLRETRQNTLVNRADTNDPTFVARFIVEAPTGFAWDGTPTSIGTVNLNNAGGTALTVATTVNPTNSRQLFVDLPNGPFYPENALRTISLEGLTLTGFTAAMGDFSLRVFNANRSTADSIQSAGITNATVIAGTRVDWGVTFERATPARDTSMTMPAIPNLITGRYDISRRNFYSTGQAGHALNANNSTGRITMNNFISGDWLVDNNDPQDVWLGNWEFERDTLAPLAQGMDAPIAYNALSHRLARVRVEETILNSWNLDRETVFTLPEGVSFLRVDITTSTGLNLTNTNRTAGTNAENMDNNRLFNRFTDHLNLNTADAGGAVSGAGRDLVVLNDNRLEFVNLTRHAVPHTDRIVLEFDAWVSVSPTFAPADGSQIDIEMEISGGAMGDVEPVVVATAQRPIVIETTVTDASIGFQRVPTADVVIRETVAGVLREDFRVRTTIQNPPGFAATGALSGIPFQSGAWSVEDGDIEIRLVPTTATYRDFYIETESTVASTLRLSNVAVHLDRTLAWTEVPYNVQIGGSAIVRNVGHSEITNRRRTGMFGVGNLTEPYINIATPAQEPLQSEVRVAAGRLYMMIDGEASATFDAAAFNHDGTMMIPIRFISYALGLSADDIIWANGVGGAGGTVSIMGPNNRTIRFQVGSTEMLINGGPVTMADAMGRPVAAMNVNDRVFIPFRQIGNAFSIPVEWDAEAGEAIFNRR